LSDRTEELLERIALALEESTRVKVEYANKMNALEAQRTSARNSSGSPSGTSAELATPKQLKYITDLSKKLGVFPGDLANLTIPEASAKIGELRAKVFRH